MNNSNNLFKLPVYEEPIYIVVAVSDKADIEKEVNNWNGLSLEAINSCVDYSCIVDGKRYFFFKVLRNEQELADPFLVRLIQAGRVILSCRYKICTNITSDKFEITEDKDTRTYSFKINNSENVFTILDKNIITLRDYANILFEFSNGIDDGFVERVIVKENYTEDDVAKSAILDIYNLIQKEIPDTIKNNIKIKPSINISLSL